MKNAAVLEDQQYLFPVAEIETPPATGQVEFLRVESVIGSGFEQQVAALALEDGIAHRAARKNMQIHSAIIPLVGGEFAGFFTFQNNAKVGDTVRIEESRPLSRDKRWRVVEVVARGSHEELVG